MQTSVNGPNAGSEQLKEMPIRVAKVNAPAASRPSNAALDRNAPFTKQIFPSRQGFRWNTKTDVCRACRAVWWDCAEWQARAARIAAADE